MYVCGNGVIVIGGVRGAAKGMRCGGRCPHLSDFVHEMYNVYIGIKKIEENRDEGMTRKTWTAKKSDRDLPITGLVSGSIDFKNAVFG